MAGPVAASGAMAEVQTGALFGPASDRYEVGRELGSGAASRVFACRRLNTGECLAVKAVDLRRLCLLGDLHEQLSRLDGEVGILHELNHECIVNLRGFHKTEHWYFLVMELVDGGELFDLIVSRKSLNEAEARHIFVQLLEGIGYMHDRGVIHRDLKPENILVAGCRPAAPPASGFLYDVKIADFGLSKAIGGGASLARTRVGTPQYWAPEVLDVQRRGGSYDHQADFWGLGAILFVMLCGRYPFDGQKQNLDDQIRTAAYSMTGARWRGISEAAKSLVRGLLRVNPVDRLSLDECLRHPWVTGEPLPTSRKPCGSPAVPAVAKKCLEQQQEAAQREQLYSRTENRRAVAASPEVVQTEAVEPEHDPDRMQSGTARPCKDAQRKPLAARTDSRRPAPAPLEVAQTEPVESEHAPDRTQSGTADRALSTSCCSVSTTLSSPSSQEAVEVTSLEATATSSESANPVFAVVGSIIAALQRIFSTYMQLFRRPGWALGALGVALVVHSFLNSWSSFERFEAPEPQQPVVVVSTSSNVGHGSTFATPKLEPSSQNNRGQGLSGTSGMERKSGPESEEDFVRQQASPSFHFLGVDTDSHDCTDQQTIFRLGELLKLQVSIAGSLEMANLAFRHADAELAEATRAVFHQAKELFKAAAQIVSRYAEVASQVSHTVLPDLQLAVQEQEPALAASLLDIVKSWVADMKKDSDVMRINYGDLQSKIVSLSQRAQRTKQAADIHLAEAVREAASEAATSTLFGQPAQPDREPAKTSASSSSSADQASAEDGKDSPDNRALTSHLGQTYPSGLNICQSWGTDPFRKSNPASSSSHGQASNGASSKTSDGTAATASVHLNSLTQSLFDQLSALGGLPESKGRGPDSEALIPVPGHSAAQTHDVEAWQRNVIDLLFMAPGVSPSASTLQKPQNASTALSVFAGSARENLGTSFAPGIDLTHQSQAQDSSGLTVYDEEDETNDAGQDAWTSHAQLNSSSAPLAVVRYVTAQDAKARAERAARSSASLLRALRELRRVDSILEGCFHFWANMDGTVQRLGQMKEHAERLVNFASSKPKLRDRFEQRMKEYASFWSALEQLCNQYSVDHQAVSSKMRDFIREVSDAADLVDTAESARAGIQAAAVVRNSESNLGKSESEGSGL